MSPVIKIISAVTFPSNAAPNSTDTDRQRLPAAPLAVCLLYCATAIQVVISITCPIKSSVAYGNDADACVPQCKLCIVKIKIAMHFNLYRLQAFLTIHLLKFNVILLVLVTKLFWWWYVLLTRQLFMFCITVQNIEAKLSAANKKDETRSVCYMQLSVCLVVDGNTGKLLYR